MASLRVYIPHLCLHIPDLRHDLHNAILMGFLSVT